MKLALGTVQFGLDYGITNSTGLVSREEVKSILSLAGAQKIHTLDTAAGYGRSETVLGALANKSFNIISKIPSLSNLQGTINESLSTTLHRLNRETLYGMMLHDERDISKKSQYNELISLKKEGLITKIGCSFYSLEALEFALNENIELDIIQIPGSCLDQRFEKSGLLNRAKENEIEIHCRSVFLQGLLLTPVVLTPVLKEFEAEINAFYKFAESYYIKPIDLALSYIYQSKHIDYGVVGCQSKSQLEQIISSYKDIENKKLNIPLAKLASTSEVLLNPSLWS